MSTTCFFNPLLPPSTEDEGASGPRARYLLFIIFLTYEYEYIQTKGILLSPNSELVPSVLTFVECCRVFVTQSLSGSFPRHRT